MRDYQLAGLNWLIRLYENGINGILADEMVSNEPQSSFHCKVMHIVSPNGLVHKLYLHLCFLLLCEWIKISVFHLLLY